MGSLWGQEFHIRVMVCNMGSRVQFWGQGVLNAVGGDFGVRGLQYGVKGSILGSGVLNGVFMGSRVQYWGQGS